jgi:hypothetical protein
MGATSRKTSSVEDQLNAAAVDAINAARIADELRELAVQDGALNEALKAMQKVWTFIGSPEKILGNKDTKHGEIAEQLEVALRRARDLLARVTPTAEIDNVPRTSPVDYTLNGIDVQSKFINGAENSLWHVLKHMAKYENFGRDGSFYHIPKDQHEVILKLLNGETVKGLKASTVKAILAKVAEIEEKTGHSFQEVVQPSASTYAEVQQGKIVETLGNHEDDLKQQNEAIKDNIRVEHQPSLAEGLKAAGIGAAVGAAVSFASTAFKKYQDEGKNVFKGDFTKKDWKEVGLSSAKGAAIGGVSAGAIYALTNFAELSAPFAGAFVAAVKGLAPLVNDYRAGKISFDALVDGGMFVCSDVALVGICTAAGQALIPVPVLGAVVGSIAGKVLSTILSRQVKGIQAAVDARMTAAMAKLEAAYQQVVANITAEFARLGALTKVAFDLTCNERLVAEHSLILARAYGVEERLLTKSHDELEAFLLG